MQLAGRQLSQMSVRRKMMKGTVKKIGLLNRFHVIVKPDAEIRIVPTYHGPLELS